MEHVGLNIDVSSAGFAVFDRLNSGLQKAETAMSSAMKTAASSSEIFKELKEGIANYNAELIREMEMNERQRVTLGALTIAQEELTKKKEAWNEVNREAALTQEKWQVNNDTAIGAAEIYLQILEELQMEEEQINEIIKEGLSIKEADLTVEQKRMNAALARLNAMDGYVAEVDATHFLAHANALLETTYANLSVQVDDSRKFFEQLYYSKEKAYIQAVKMRHLNLDQMYVLGELSYKTEQLAYNQEYFNQLLREYYLVVQSGVTDQQVAIEMGKEIIYQRYLDAEATEIQKKQEQALNMERGRSRAELMQMSIGMFVLGITATQTLGAMSAMFERIPVMSEMFKELQGAVRAVLGPLQVFYALQQFINMENKKLLLSSLPLMAALGSLYLFMRAFNHESKIVRFGLGALAGAFGILSLATWKQTAALWALVKGQLAMVASNPMTFWKTPILIAAVAAAVMAGTAMAAAGGRREGQTIPGYFRPVTDTGWFYAHRGETVGRVNSMQPGVTNNRAVNVNITIESGASVDDGLIRKLSREIERTVASGNGV